MESFTKPGSQLVSQPPEEASTVYASFDNHYFLVVAEQELSFWARPE